MHTLKFFEENDPFHGLDLCELPEKALIHAIEQAPVAMFFIDRTRENSPILYANPAFSRMTGYSTAEASGLSLFVLKGDDTSESEILAIRQALLNMRPHRATLKGYRKDGVHFWADATISPVIEPGGGCRCYYVVMDDVTVKKDQEALITSQQKNLVASQKMAALGQMAAGIAHEIKNPLSIIRGRSEILMQEVRSGKTPSATRVQETAQSIMKTVDRIVKIVRGLRGISSSSDVDPFVETAISDAISDAVEFSKEKILRKGIDFRVPDIPRDTRITCRSEQIVQVLLNLLLNAADQLEKGNDFRRYARPWIRIDYTETATSIEIAVVDSGTGISPSIRERLFEPFTTTKETDKGMGLGLFLSKSIIEAHSGTLQVDPHSRNTRFVVTLPRKLDYSCLKIRQPCQKGP